MEKRNPKLHYGRLQPHNAVFRMYAADIPNATDRATLLDPEYWSHYASDLKPNDLVIAQSEDGDWECWLRVRFVGTAEVRMAVLFSQNYTEDKIAEDAGATHKIKWISPPKKFGVIRISDNAVVKDGMYPREQAEQFLRTLMPKKEAA